MADWGPVSEADVNAATQQFVAEVGLGEPGDVVRLTAGGETVEVVVQA